MYLNAHRCFNVLIFRAVILPYQKCAQEIMFFLNQNSLIFKTSAIITPNAPYVQESSLVLETSTLVWYTNLLLPPSKFLSINFKFIFCTCPYV
jgi:hypothetical protein